MTKPAMPKPPQCARYQADGKRCTNTTARADQWCGTCDGFLKPSGAPLPPRDEEFVRTRPAPLLDERVPLDLADLADIAVTRTAIQAFIGSHGGSAEAAEAQIRSLLEDALLDGRYSKRLPDGAGWVLSVNKKGAFKVLITPDCEAVMGYSTKHAERTWEQVKAGVPSRISPKGTTLSREVMKKLDAYRVLPGGVRLTPKAADLYLKRNGLGRITPSTVDEVMPLVVAAASRALKEWNGVDRLLADPDREGCRWVTEHGEDGNPALVLYLTPDRVKGEPGERQPPRDAGAPTQGD